MKQETEKQKGRKTSGESGSLGIQGADAMQRKMSETLRLKRQKSEEMGESGT